MYLSKQDQNGDEKREKIFSSVRLPFLSPLSPLSLPSYLPSFFIFSPIAAFFIFPKKSISTMADTDTCKHDGDGENQVLSYRPLAVNSAVSANPHIPSVTASAVLGESESVSRYILMSADEDMQG